MKKHYIIGFIAASSLSMLITAWAQMPLLPSSPSSSSSSPSSPPSPPSPSLFCDTCSLLGSMYAWFQNQSAMPVLPDDQLSNLTAVNGVPTNQAVISAAATETGNNLDNSMTQFLYAMYQNDTQPDSPQTTLTTASGGPFSNYVNDNSAVALSIGQNTQANDTLYINSSANLSRTAFKIYNDPNNKPLLKKPETLHNDYFSFASLIAPTAYTTEQKTAADYFIKYAAQSTQNLTTGVNFSALYNQPAALLALKQNPAYQQYVLTIRALLAVRSITLNTLDTLVAERTPTAALGKIIGTSSASPLQIEAYQANNRVENPAWYTLINNDSPAAVERTIAVELAEIEHQNYQAHLDRERLLSAITAMNLQTSLSGTQALLQQQSTAVNDAINSAIASSTPTKPKKQS